MDLPTDRTPRPRPPSSPPVNISRSPRRLPWSWEERGRSGNGWQNCWFLRERKFALPPGPWIVRNKRVAPISDSCPCGKNHPLRGRHTEATLGVACRGVQLVVAAGAAGVELLSAEKIKSIPTLKRSRHRLERCSAVGLGGNQGDRSSGRTGRTDLLRHTSALGATR